MHVDWMSIVVILVIIINVIWYYIKFIVYQHGFETHLFRGHWSDLRNMAQIIDEEQNTTKKNRFRILLYGFYAAIFLTLAGFVTIVFLETRN